MKLRSFETECFAGIRNKELSFADGMNVILGPNEAGKSTIVEAIFATIFQEEKLRMNLSADKEFRKRAMPYPDGDYINGILEFEVSGRRYRLKKEWGNNNSVLLESSDGKILRSSEKIKEELKELFTFGQAAYANIVFARQQDLKELIKNILSDDSIINTVSTFLRKAVMELEGVSIEELLNRVDTELNELAKKWNLQKNRPDNLARDINNPYKVGYGKIYEAYIRWTGVEMKIKQASEVEIRFEEIGQDLKELEEKRGILREHIKEMADREDDIFRRGTLEPEIKRLKEKSAELKKINSQWPIKEEELTRKNEEIEKLEEIIRSLKEEKLQAAKKQLLEKDRELLKKIDMIKEKIEEKKEEQDKLQRVSLEVLVELKRLEGIIKRDEAFLQASTLIAKINKAEGEVQITRGINDKEVFSTGAELKAEAYLHIEVEDLLNIEIQSGEIDFEELKKEYQETKSKLKEILAALKLDNIEQASLFREKFLALKNEVENLETQIDNLLDKREYNDLREDVEKLAELETNRNPEEIETELEEKSRKKIELLAEVRSISVQINDWQAEYGEVEKLLDKLVDIRVELQGHQKELEGLAQLPEGYGSVEEFKYELSSSREEKDRLDELINIKKGELAEITTELAEESSEELAVLAREYNRDYRIFVKKADNLLKIRRVIDRKVEEMDNDTFTPLLNSFSKYLAHLTSGNYQLGEMDDEFQLEIRNSKDQRLPVDINFLSFGTYDGVALAFRLALIEQLFEKKGFIVLDDCLVNLDPERKREAVRLLKRFAEDFQLIFSTCSPETAEELGGNVIELIS